MQPAYATPAPIAKDLSSIVQAVFAMALGLFIVGVVGFSHVEAIHTVAHDVRHSNAFPCH
jgi:cobalt transporter subunit CbtB